jgi:hypothetical protein
MGLAPTGKRRLVTAHTHNVISTVIRCAAKGSLDYPVDSNKSGDGDPAEPEITGLAPSRGQVMLLMKPG